MTFATLSNLATIMFCAAVLVQSVRMMRSLKAVRGEAFAQIATVVDRSTGEARLVLSELKTALAECEHGQRAIIDVRALIDELTVMVGIANASADHMAEMASAARRAAAAEDYR